jgi:hypothetical protein
MGEISFNYNVKPEPVQEIGFQYFIPDSIEYSFAYQRYIAFSDASIFNSPVAITKVATGLSQLYGLFADRKIGNLAYFDLIKAAQNSKSNVRKKDMPFGAKQKSNTDIYEVTTVDKTQNSNTNVVAIKHGLEKDDLILNENRTINAGKDDNKAYDDVFFTADKNVNVGTSYMGTGYWFLKYVISNINDIILMDELHDQTLDVYKQIFAVTNINRLNILKVMQAKRVNDSTLNKYSILFGALPEIKFNITKNISGQTFDNILNIFQNAVLSPFDVVFNTIQNIAITPFHDIIANKFKMYFGTPNTLKMSLLYNLFVKKADVIRADIDSTLHGRKPDNIGNIYDIVSGTDSNERIFIYDFAGAYQYGKVGSRFNTDTSGNKDEKHGLVNYIESTIKEGKNGFMFEDKYNVLLNEKPLCYFDLDTFVVSEEKYCIAINGVAVDKDLKTSHYDRNPVFYFKDSKKLQMNSHISLNLDTKEMMTSTMIYVDKDNKSTKSDNQFFITNNGKLLHPINNVLFVDKAKHNFSLYSQFFISKENSEMDMYSLLSFGKFSANMSLHTPQISITKDKMDMTIYKDQLFIDKDRNGFVIHDTSVFIDKDRHNLNMEQLNGLFIRKIKKDMLPKDSTLGVYRDSYKMLFFTEVWTENVRTNMTILDQLSIDRDDYCISIFKQGQTLIKKLTIVDVPDFDFVIKNNIPTDYSNILTDNFTGMIIPISKVKRHSYINNINIMVQKISKEGYIHQGDSASVIPRNACVQSFDLFCDKKEFNLYIDYKNTQVTRNKVRTFIGKNEFLKKTPVYMALEGSIWTDKKISSIWSEKQIETQKKARRGFLDMIIGITGGNRNVYTNDSMFMDKKEQMCYYDYNTTWVDKPVVDARIQDQLRLDGKYKETHMFDCVSPFIKQELEGYYDYGVFGNKAIQESDLFRQINDVHRKAYDTGIRPEDFGNWAWVYETPDPFDKGFGIDELLLPENDTRYENFEDIIFDKENMVPRNPVKEIDENTFIAKYPIRHPLPKYKDVGVDYDKGAIKIDQFYGVEVSVMHAVFLKFYRIWQSKIFEFGTMTMTQSVKLMLEYLYAWIMEYFPLEQVEQALRVFRLIRWYGETSIIRNSQYIVSYEYDTLESKLNTGNCMIPNDLDAQDTMYVDAALGIIRNNPIYIGDGLTNAYVTFEVNNRKNSTFTFSLSNTVGSVNIYINDTLVDTVSKSALNLTYELPYTGDANIVKIEKLASHNLNGTFYIGNIKVPNCTFKELSIEFDPNLKAGNKPLNEIAQKMIAYANMYEDKEAIYEIIRKGNLGVGEIYKKLTEYWKLHHQDKTKGKRLTIKEV